MDQNPQNVESENERLFLELFEAYNDRIFRFIYFQVKDRSQALDITQEVFVNIWQYIGRGKEIENPEAFLYKTARNEVIDFFKKKKALSLDGLLDEGFEPGKEEFEEYLKKDDLIFLSNLINDLNPKEKQIMVLRYIEELPIEEIAEQFNKSANAMTVQIHRIVRRLKEKYKENNGK